MKGDTMKYGEKIRLCVKRQGKQELFVRIS